ncbi:hypothetical protein J6590_088431 [Homalodisca vitripennis]|nr:hypothetical protein J6590_088431 [Homalodisca vitripennis]
MASTSHMTIEEILLLLRDLEESEANVASANFVVLPPQNVDCLTDEEQFNDDNTEDVDISEVCGTLELELKQNNDLDCKTSNESKPTKGKPENANSRKVLKRKFYKPHKSTDSKKKKVSRTTPRTWKKCLPEYGFPAKGDGSLQCLNDLKERFHSKSPVEIFESLLTTDIMQDIVTQTMKYALEIKK